MVPLSPERENIERTWVGTTTARRSGEASPGPLPLSLAGRDDRRVFYEPRTNLTTFTLLKGKSGG